MPTEADQIESLQKALKESCEKLKKAQAEKREAQARARKAEKKAERSDARAKRTADKLKEARAEAKAAQKKAAAAEVLKDGRTSCIKGAVALVTRSLELLASVPKDLPQADLKQIDLIIEGFESLMEHAKSLDHLEPYVKAVFGPRSERIGSGKKSSEQLKKEAEEADDQADKLRGALQERRRTIKKRQSELRRNLDDIKKAAQEAQAQEGEAASPAVKIVAAIDRVQTPSVPEKAPLPNGKTTLGKQKVDYPPVGEIPSPEGFVCQHCGSPNISVVELLEYASMLRHMTKNVSRLTKFARSTHHVVECSHCHRLNLVVPANEPVPVRPRGTVSQDLVLATAYLAYRGVPEQRSRRIFHLDELQLGHSTIGDGMFLWDLDYAAPLQRETEKRCKCAPVIVVDETPFAVLQQKGQSKVVLKDKPSQGYVLVVCSAPHARLPFAFYYQLDGRSGKYIRQRLEGFTPEALVTDGYGEYFSDAMAETLGFKPGEAFHQTCMVHFRRVVMDAVCPFFNGPVLTAEDLEAIRKKLDEASPAYILAGVLEALSKIYGHEENLKPGKDEDYEAFLDRVARSRRKNATVLMDCIDGLMELIREKLVVRDPVKGQYEAIDQNSSAAKAVRYYFNHRDELRLFLKDPRVPPDSNTAERSVRAVAVLEDACKFKQSPEYLASLCRYFSLFATAELYGIKSPEKWLLEYGRALYTYRGSRTAEHLRGKGQLRGKMNCFTEDSAEGFDFEPWLPWNYAAAKGFSPSRN